MSLNDIAAAFRKRAQEKGDLDDTPPDFEELHLIRTRILGVLIRDAREAGNISAADCAAQIGVGEDVLQAWELGQTTPSLPQLELLAYTLGVPISHFWGMDMLEHSTTQQVNADDYVLLRNRLIGGVLRQAREAAGLTQAQLAEGCGISPANVAAYELGQRAIPMPVLVSLASACRVNLSYFLEHGNRVGQVLLLQEDMKNLGALDAETRQFVSKPVNKPYLDLARKLADMGTDELRTVAEMILEITL